MPTYEYECQKCGKIFEIFQKMTDAPLEKCISCDGEVKRLIGLGGGVIYKGPGFYTTEYRSQEYKKKEKEEKSQAAVSAGGNGADKSACASCSQNVDSTCKK
ncbi:MAG: zinc ribbon domain-containing protein [Candidatus Omnitrophica bacterium]|nr:zinc ribbon domain-containing protein [Candidatus Omnitrophota bacterium]